MSSMRKVKRKIGIAINKMPIRGLAEKCNLLLFHWNDRMHWLRNNGNGHEKYFVIRPQTDTQGLLSTYLYVLKNIRWAERNGFIPFIDFENENCQYYTGRVVNGSKNAWEYYFKQPLSFTKDSIYKKDNILLSGWSLKKKYYIEPIPKKPSAMKTSEIKFLVKKYMGIESHVVDAVDQKYQELFHGKTLGVFLRGTDYVKLKPKGHAIQPDIQEVIKKIQEFLNKYKINQIFVVTEDGTYFQKLKDTFGEMVFSSDDYFIDNYSKNEYVQSSFTNDAYERGLNYLIRILLLTKCSYLISSITNGSLVSYCLKEDKYEDEFWFDLGTY